MVKKTLIFSLLLLTAMVGPAVAYDLPELYTSMQVNPGLRGDVLLGYLYDIRDIDGVSQKTLINVVNTDPNYGVVAKMRFREYKRSRECIDFHFPLSKGDVWSAEVYQCRNGLNEGHGYVFSNDFNSIDIMDGADSWPLRHDLRIQDTSARCDDADSPNLGAGVAFRVGAMNAGEQNPARCLYGYYEIIGEERVSGDFSIYAAPTPTGVYGYVDRVEPSDLCGPGFTGLSPCGRDAQNSLFAETWLVRVEDGTAQQYADLAISNFSVNPAGIKGPVTGTSLPTLQSGAQGSPTNLPGFGGFGQLESILSKRYIFAQYWADPDFLAKTSIVVTFPTKWAHFDPAAPHNTATRPFVGPNETVQDGNTDPFLFVLRDREEHIMSIPQSDVIFSPYSSSGPPVTRWPFEVNILGLSAYDKTALPGIPHSVIDDADLEYYYRDNLIIKTFVSGGDPPFTEGWINIDLSPNNNGVPDPVSGNAGLPALIPGEQGLDTTHPFNFWFQPFNATNFTGFRGLPVIGGVLTEVTYASVPALNYRTAIPWASAVHWPWSAAGAP
jgi:hypothetical protein